MDNEKSITTASTVSAMPRSTPFAAAIAGADMLVVPSLSDQSSNGGRNVVFASLVKDDADIAGLVAYSIYKQHKLDWLTAFEAMKGRAPNEAELASYIIGEGTPRRLATYRHLAEAVLAGNGPDTAGQPAPGRAPFQRRSKPLVRGTMTPGLIATYGLIALLFLIGLWLAARFTMNSR